ncbi:hypothetical protein [Pedobacter nanyangensis]|uniref:hypothetical protein n=1 Tax=Pedobacter nanyangensis TaxID=1562389 RepID=UPI000DE37186|nr:hypothetical protein [Pedobacter nanyangensis]
MAWFIVVPKLRVSAMAIYPFILVQKTAYKTEAILVNHEKIHHRQQLELLIVPFYLFYLINYLYNLLKYRKHHVAYLNIVFEKEAFAQQHNLAYLNSRKLFSWIKYARR